MPFYLGGPGELTNAIAVSQWPFPENDFKVDHNFVEEVPLE